MIKLFDKLFSNKVVRFVMIGGCSTGIDFVIYMVLSIWLPVTVSKGISMICSSMFSYVANKHFTFSNNEKTTVSYLFKFYIVFGINLGTNVGINYLLYLNTGSKLLAFVIATLAGMTVNYLGQRYFVFPPKRSSDI